MEVNLKGLIEYGHHANEQLIDILVRHREIASAKSVKLMSHIINAESIWIGRIQGSQSPHGVWDVHEIGDLKSLDRKNYKMINSIISSSSGDELVEYVNTEGHLYQNSIRDILFHLVNHGTYHRGQLAVECRARQIEPLVSDFIFYKRDQSTGL